MTAEKCSQCGVRKSYAQAVASGKIHHVTNSYLNLSPCADVKPEKEEDNRIPSLTNQREELKRAIIRSRPLGSQLDTCKSAGRADCALKPTEDAKRALQTTDADLDKKRAELAELKCTSTYPADSSLTVSSAVARALHHLKSVPTQFQSR